MGTSKSNIETVSGIAGELTKIIPVNSLAHQVCSVQYSDSVAPQVFGIKKGATDVSFLMVSKDPTNTFTATSDSDGFSEEMIDDMFAIFGESAIETLKVVASNNLADALDAAVVLEMLSTSSKTAAVTYDFTTTTDHRSIIHNLLLKINKERMVMSKAMKRGIPDILIVSANVGAILLTNGMVSGADKDWTAGKRENIKHLGQLGDMTIFCDFNALTEYCLLAYKGYIKGDASMILIPIREPKPHLVRNKETGLINLHFSQKYAFSRNPLDTGTSTNDSDFMSTFALTLTGFDAL